MNANSSPFTVRKPLFLFTAILILWVGFGLRLWQLGNFELWFDETASTFIAAKSVVEIWKYVTTVGFEHPPLYYTVLHFWIELVGDSEFSIRYLSVAFGMGFVALLGRLLLQSNGSRVSLMALLLAATSPFLIIYSQEARMYSAVMLWGLALFLVVFRARRLSGKVITLFALITVVGCGFSYFFVPYAIVCAIALWGKTRKNTQHWKLLAWATILAIGGVTALWFVPSVQLSLTKFWATRGDPSSWLPKIGTALIHVTGLVYRFDTIESIGVILLFWAVVLLGVWYSPYRRFFLLFSAALPLTIILPVLDGRYFSAPLFLLYFYSAVTLAYLYRRARWGALLLLLALLAANAYPLLLHYDRDHAYFGAALQSATAAVRDKRDVLVVTEPDAWPLVDYYGRRLPEMPPMMYFPQSHDSPPVTSAEVDEMFTEMLPRFDRIVIGPHGAQNRDPQFLVENFLLQHAFAATRDFYPDSTMVAVFITPKPLQPGPADILFDNNVYLKTSEVSSLTVSANSAIVTRLVWERRGDTLPPLFVSLQLQDEQGNIWATQQSAPCNGWCATPTWESDTDIIDNRALLLPDTLPIGTYRLFLRLDSDAGAVGTPVLMGDVTVNEVPAPTKPVPAPETVLGSVGVEALQIEQETVQLGNSLTWSGQWYLLPDAPRDWEVVWRFVKEGALQYEVASPPTLATYPVSDWQPSAYIQGRGTLSVPASLTPGTYTVEVALRRNGTELLGAPIPVRTIQITDRPHQFTLPSIGISTDGFWEQGIQLARVQFPEKVDAGTTLPLTLVWQATQATDQNYKIFIHLRDANNVTVAQHDFYSGNKSTPTNSWLAGEVLVDEQTLTLPQELVGDYQVVIGFYREDTQQRLPLQGQAKDEFVIGTVHVQQE